MVQAELTDGKCERKRNQGSLLVFSLNYWTDCMLFGDVVREKV